MITVDVEMHPRGDQRVRRTLSRISIWNDISGDYEYGNYQYLITGDAGISSGSIIGHRRDTGVLALLKAVLVDSEL